MNAKEYTESYDRYLDYIDAVTNNHDDKSIRVLDRIAREHNLKVSLTKDKHVVFTNDSF